MTLRVDEMFVDPVQARARRELVERWTATGLHAGHTIAEQAARAAESTPETRLVFPSTDRPSSISLRDLWSRSCRVAAALRAQGVQRDDIVAVQVPNWSEAAIAYVAAAAAGATVLPIVHTYGTTDTDWILERVRPRVLVLPERWAGRDYVERLDAMPAVEHVEHVVVVGDRAPGRASVWADLESFDAPTFEPTAFEPATGDPNEPFLIAFTSGTTAEPKGIVHSHNSFLAELRSMPSPPHSTRPLRAMQPWPAGHIGGMTAIMGPLVHGFDTYLLDRWDTDAVIDLIMNEGISAASAVPTALTWLMDAVEGAALDLPLRELTTGGAGILSTLIERGLRFDWHIGRCYGSSEHPSATVCTRADSLEHRLYSDGAPMEGTELRILRDDGTEGALGEAGEIALIGPEQFLGYTDPELNRDSITRDGWLLTGDIGVVDADGFLTVTDRKKDLIIRAGENISSVEVEEILTRHPAVAEAAVVASPDPEYGERICAFVVVRPGHTLQLDDVQRHFETSGVQRQKTPEVLRIVAAEDVPRTPSGKVRKPDLRDRLRAERGATSGRS